MKEIDGRQVVSVSEMHEIVSSELFNLRFWVEGEISEFQNNPAWVFTYFNLKDESSIIKVKLSRNLLSSLAFELSDGMKLLIYGNLETYGPKGTININPIKIEEFGEGDLLKAIEKLKRELLELGYFEESIKKALPQIPQRIGLITSEGGEVYHDIVEGLRRRFPLIQIVFVHSSVQGYLAEKEISNAIKLLDKTRTLDFIVIARGGGSLEDLMTFNSRTVADSIFESTTPIVTAIGHQRNSTIADIVADLSLGTPSKVVEQLFPDKVELLNYFDNLMSKIRSHISKEIFNKNKELENYMRYTLRYIDSSIKERLNKLDVYTKNMNKSIFNYTTSRGEKLNSLMSSLQWSATNYIYKRVDKIMALEGLLRSLNPLSVLSRGFSVVYDSNERLIKSNDQVKIGENIKVTLHKGGLTAQVKESNG